MVSVVVPGRPRVPVVRGVSEVGEVSVFDCAGKVRWYIREPALEMIRRAKTGLLCGQKKSWSIAEGEVHGTRGAPGGLSGVFQRWRIADGLQYSAQSVEAAVLQGRLSGSECRGGGRCGSAVKGGARSAKTDVRSCLPGGDERSGASSSTSHLVVFCIALAPPGHGISSL